eukprot:CAMPEP_0119004962 /NCGR_PEP_ID=MMETSP1176-20130426/1444_1 /TAXON_ID=265551 /ORGANISM="Synedropsis recta cf, Strain CCMP1620" /LENGTH=485 /DNA_ID=CAMNT_0006956723 /DNA_START=106 /DNA_END=1563 /DNA_ORIENTATION=-
MTSVFYEEECKECDCEGCEECRVTSVFYEEECNECDCKGCEECRISKSARAANQRKGRGEETKKVKTKEKTLAVPKQARGEYCDPGDLVKLSKKNFDNYVASKKVVRKMDEYLDPIKEIWENILEQCNAESEEEKLEFIAYGRKKLKKANIQEYVNAYGTGEERADKKLTKKYHGIRDFLIIRAQAIEYATSFHHDSTEDDTKLGPPVAYYLSRDGEMETFAKQMLKNGWVDSFHTDDGTESLSLSSLREGKVPVKIFILGHGSPSTPILGVKVVKGDHDEYGAKDVAVKLIAKGLPKKVKDIEILTCYGGKGTKKKLNLAREKLMAATADQKKKKAKLAAKAAMEAADEKVKTAAAKYKELMADDENFYTTKATKDFNDEWALPFAAGFLAHLKSIKNKKGKQKGKSVYTNVRVIGYTAPFLLTFPVSQIRTFALEGMKKEGFISREEFPDLHRVHETREPIGPIQLANGEWIDANKDMRKEWL